ncbi:MAG: ArsI/CadI family heavy metal resistance metalloenzyme [Acidimicrobiales bacterium]
MSRLQLALNVSNLEEAVAFYTMFFATAPAKVRSGYANFAVVDPPLKLVLIENPSAPGTINHLGVEVASGEDVARATGYLAGEGFAVEVEEATTCCYALQNKVWVEGPDGTRWETYTVLRDVPVSASTALDESVGSLRERSTECCAT